MPRAGVFLARTLRHFRDRGELHAGFGEICPELWRFKVEGVRLPPNFQRPLVAKLYVGSENVFEIGPYKNVLCHRAEFCWARASHADEGRKMSSFLFMCVCLSVRHALERRSFSQRLLPDGIGT